jgi:hypothetical protein
MNPRLFIRITYIQLVTMIVIVHINMMWPTINELSWQRLNVNVPDHDGGRPKQINAWFLYTHMVYL